MDWSVAIALLSEVCVRLGDRTRATQLYELLLPLRGRFVMLGLCVMNWGCASRYLGLLATSLQDFDRASLHFDEAISMNAAIGARPWIAHSKYNYAECLLSLMPESGEERALRLLDDARGIASELGMTNLLRRIRQLLPADASR